MKIPDFATHYYLADKAPFQNLSDLEAAKLPGVLAELAQRRATAGLQRVFGAKYMLLRRLTENRLRELFIQAGGKPERTAPHYFCLGECRWFRNLAPDMRALVAPLSALADNVTSFTYPDSVVSMGFGPQFGLPNLPRPYHGKAFRLSELQSVVELHGLPADDGTEHYEGYWTRPFERFIEVQVWSDAPLSRLPGVHFEVSA